MELVKGKARAVWRNAKGEIENICEMCFGGVAFGGSVGRQEALEALSEVADFFGFKPAGGDAGEAAFERSQTGQGPWLGGNWADEILGQKDAHRKAARAAARILKRRGIDSGACWFSGAQASDDAKWPKRWAAFEKLCLGKARPAQAARARPKKGL